MARFIGMSTFDKVRAPYILTDDELVKRDLLNEFYTKRGERVMRPQFGSIIWEILMDPSTPDLEKQVEDDIKKIIDRDPRVSLLRIESLAVDHTIRADVIISYVATNNEDVLYLNYTRDAANGTT